MSIVVALVVEPKLDVGTFAHAAKSLTGENPVREADSRPGNSPLADYVTILKGFAGLGCVDAVTHVGFVVAGPMHQMNQFLTLASGLEYVDAKNMGPDARGVLIVASLEEWKSAVVWACSMGQTEAAEPAVRKAFNDIQRTLKQRGFGNMFKEYRVWDNNDGSEILRLK